MLKINSNWNMHASFFSQVKFDSLFSKAVELNPINYVWGGGLSLFALKNFMDTWNKKVSGEVKWRQLGIRDLYNIVSLSTLILPLAGIAQTAPTVVNYCYTNLHRMLPGFSLIPVIGVNLALWQANKRISSWIPSPLHLVLLNSVFDIAESYLINFGSAVYNTATLKPTAGNIANLVGTGLGLGVFYYSKEVINLISPYAQIINATNASAMLMLRSIDIIRGRDRESSKWEASLSIILHVGGFISLNAAINAGVVLAIGGATSSFFGLDGFYAKILRPVDRFTIVSTAVYMTPQVLSAVFGTAVPYALSSASGFISSIGIPQFLSSIATIPAVTSVATAVSPVVLTIAAPVGLIVGSRAIIKSYELYSNWMENIYKDKHSILHDSNNVDQKFHFFHPVTNLFKIISNRNEIELRKGWMEIPAIGAIGGGLIVATVLCLTSMVLFSPITTPIISSDILVKGVLLAGMPGSGIAATITNIGLVTGAGAIAGGFFGMLHGEAGWNALKGGVIAGGAIGLLTYYGIGSIAGLAITSVLTPVIVNAVPILIGAGIASPIITAAYAFAYERKKPEYMIQAESLLDATVKLHEVLSTFPWDSYPDFPFPDNKASSIIGSLIPDLPAVMLPQINFPAPEIGTSTATPQPAQSINELLENLRKVGNAFLDKYQLDKIKAETLEMLCGILKNDIKDFDKNLSRYIEFAKHTPDKKKKIEEEIGKILSSSEKCKTCITNIIKELEPLQISK